MKRGVEEGERQPPSQRTFPLGPRLGVARRRHRRLDEESRVYHDRDHAGADEPEVDVLVRALAAAVLAAAAVARAALVAQVALMEEMLSAH